MIWEICGHHSLGRSPLNPVYMYKIFKVYTCLMMLVRPHWNCDACLGWFHCVNSSTKWDCHCISLLNISRPPAPLSVHIFWGCDSASAFGGQSVSVCQPRCPHILPHWGPGRPPNNRFPDEPNQGHFGSIRDQQFNSEQQTELLSSLSILIFRATLATKGR